MRQSNNIPANDTDIIQFNATKFDMIDVIAIVHVVAMKNSSLRPFHSKLKEWSNRVDFGTNRYNIILKNFFHSCYVVLLCPNSYFV
jgi:hypothetical protein